MKLEYGGIAPPTESDATPDGSHGCGHGMKRKPSAFPADGHPAFAEVRDLILTARGRAYQSVNAELVMLYHQIAEYISRKIESAEWGDGVVAELARYLARTQPGLRGFTRPNLFRMRQFYEAYRENEIVSALLRQLP